MGGIHQSGDGTEDKSSDAEAKSFIDRYAHSITNYWSRDNAADELERLKSKISRLASGFESDKERILEKRERLTAKHAAKIREMVDKVSRDEEIGKENIHYRDNLNELDERLKKEIYKYQKKKSELQQEYRMLETVTMDLINRDNTEDKR
jgi:chaperonin cofactor prefoldin